MAGDEFMSTVFHLKPDQIGVAMNAPETVAYVIRLTDVQPVARGAVEAVRGGRLQQVRPGCPSGSAADFPGLAGRDQDVGRLRVAPGRKLDQMGESGSRGQQDGE